MQRLVSLNMAARALAFALLYILWAAAVDAGEYLPILASRTGEVGSVLEGKRFQLDLTPYYSSYKDRSSDLWALNFAFSMALSSGWQLEITGDTLSYESPDLGLADLSVGAKWIVCDAPLMLVLTGYLSLPSGTGDFGGDGLSPSLYLTGSGNITDRVSLSASLGSTYQQESEQDFFSAEWSAYILYAISDRDTVDVFHSGYTVGQDSDGSCRLAVGIDYTHALDDRVSVGATVMKGISVHGMDWSAMLTGSYAF